MCFHKHYISYYFSQILPNYNDTYFTSNRVKIILLQIEVKAVPVDKKELGDSRKVRRVSQPDELTFGGHAQPSLDTPYEVTVRDQMCYNAITMMKVNGTYEVKWNESVEEKLNSNSNIAVGSILL